MSWNGPFKFSVSGRSNPSYRSVYIYWSRYSQISVCLGNNNVYGFYMNEGGGPFFFRPFFFFFLYPVEQVHATGICFLLFLSSFGKENTHRKSYMRGETCFVLVAHNCTIRSRKLNGFGRFGPASMDAGPKLNGFGRFGPASMDVDHMFCANFVF